MSNESPAVERLQPRRWRVLAALRRVESPATVDAVADELHERRAPSDPLAGLGSWDRTHQRLHEVDLPALHMAGLVEYDEQRGVVTIPRTAELEADGVVRAAPDGHDASDASAGTAESSGSDGSGADGASASDSRWRYRYLAAAIVAVPLVAGTATLGPEDPTLTAVAAIAVAGLFAVLSTVHVYSRR